MSTENFKESGDEGIFKMMKSIELEGGDHCIYRLEILHAEGDQERPYSVYCRKRESITLQGQPVTGWTEMPDLVVHGSGADIVFRKAIEKVRGLK
jgi:hypothetical protein